jgi:lipopolysaccharide/colanic/teichoic acid biosynthesis glycosyltransferase
MERRPLYEFIKRLFDVLVSLAILIVLSPLLLMVAVIIRLSAKGSAFFAQQRAGRNAKPFTLYKFRTMRANVDPFGPSPKSGEDPRLTSIGRFLREHSLDELPQLLNVLTGKMSLVGPRPLYVSQIPEWDDNQKRRLLVKPGLTGLAQVSGRGGLTREEKLALDVRYVDRRGLWTDTKILLATFKSVFSKKSIYEDRYSKDQYTRQSPDGQ